MITETTRITVVRNGRMHLAPVGGHCASCGAASSCGTAKLSRLLPSARRELVIDAVPGKREGDLVELELPESAVIGAAAVAYLPPLLGLLAGILVAAPFDPTLAPVGGVLGAACGLLAARVLGRRLAARLQPVPVQPDRGADRMPASMHIPVRLVARDGDDSA